MKLHIIALGTRMPSWVQTAFQDYAKRFPPHLSLQLHEIKLSKRPKNAPLQAIIQREGELMLAAIPPQSHVVALDVTGKQFDTPGFAAQLEQWQERTQSVCFLIGGPEGLSEACLARADQRCSLSALTFPHPLVRVVLVEQLYRAWSVLEQHPYHRE